MPVLKKALDCYGNDRYLLWLLKKGNLAEIESRTDKPSSTIFVLEDQMLEQYQMSAGPKVRNRIEELNYSIYSCSRVDKAGLMVAI